MKILNLNVLLVFLTGCYSLANAQISIDTQKDSLYVYDDFSIEGNVLTNENGSSGIGWDGNWTYQTGHSSGVMVNKGYIYSTKGQFGITRNLKNPILLGSSTFYTSFLAKKNASGNFRISGHRADGVDRFGIHIRPDGKLGAQAGVAFANTIISEESFFDNYKTYLVVAKYWYTDKGNMSIVVFGQGDAIPEDEESVNWDLVATGATTSVSIDYVRLAYTAHSNLLDELKIGDTWKSVTTGVVDLRFPPVAPTNISFSPKSETTLELSWTNNDPMKAGYTILQDGSPIGSVAHDVCMFEVDGLTEGENYTFGVFAHNEELNSDTLEVSITFNYSGISTGNTEVLVVEQEPTSEPNTWTYKVTEGGNYQIGYAWIWVKDEYGEVDVSIYVGEELIRTMRAESAEAPYRFETRLEDLATDDEIRVVATPHGDASYSLGYRVAYGTPKFEGLPVYDVHQYGAVGDGETSDYQAIKDAMAAAKRTGGGIVKFDGTKEYRVIGDRGYTLFDFQNNSNIKVAGNGAKIILHPYGNFVSIVQSENIQIDGFTTTYDPLPYFQGSITKIDVPNLYLEMQVPERYEAPVTGEYDVSKFGRSFWETGPDRMGAGEHLYIKRTERIGDETHFIRVYFQDHETARLQSSLNNNASHYIAPHIEYGMRTTYRNVPYSYVAYSSRVTMSNILTHSVCHFAYTVAGNFGPVTFTNVDILAPDRENDLHVVWRDGWHVWGNRYGIMIEDGDYDGGLMYDDIFSPHMKIPVIENVTGSTVRLQSKPGEAAEHYTAAAIWQKEDWVSFWDENQTTYYGMARIIDVNQTSSASRIDITLDRSIEGVAAGAFAINEETINRDMVIRNCTSSPMGRIIAVRQRTPILYQNCDFQNIHFFIYMGEPWRTRPRNVVFDNCYINERLTFHVNDTWNVTLKNCTINSAMVDLKNVRNTYLENITWTNSSVNAIEARNNSNVYVFGESIYNGTILTSTGRVFQDASSKINFYQPENFPSDRPPFLPEKESIVAFVTEPFEMEGELLTNTGSGSGWTGHWQSNTFGITIDEASSLPYPSGVKINPSGGRIHESGNSRTNERNFERHLNLANGNIYLSFLARRSANGEFAIETDNAAGHIRFGVTVNSDGYVGVRAGLNTIVSNTVKLEKETTYFVLVKFSNQGSNHAVSRVKLFKSGEDLVPEDEADIDWDVVTDPPATTGVDQSKLRIRIPSGTVELDEIILGPTYVSVTQSDDYEPVSTSSIPSVKVLQVSSQDGGIGVNVPAAGGVLRVYDLYGRSLYHAVLTERYHLIDHNLLNHSGNVIIFRYEFNGIILTNKKVMIR